MYESIIEIIYLFFLCKYELLILLIVSRDYLVGKLCLFSGGREEGKMVNKFVCVFGFY